MMAGGLPAIALYFVDRGLGREEGLTAAQVEEALARAQHARIDAEDMELEAKRVESRLYEEEATTHRILKVEGISIT